MPDAANSPARLFAPVALAVCAIAFVAILLGSDAKDDGSSDASSVAETDTQRVPSTSTERLRPQRRNYTVKTGDTLGAIAAKTGVEVEELELLNPELDPQALVAGQKIKLRE